MKVKMELLKRIDQDKKLINNNNNNSSLKQIKKYKKMINLKIN